jgi:hypothetical protein
MPLRMHLIFVKIIAPAGLWDPCLPFYSQIRVQGAHVVTRKSLSGFMCFNAWAVDQLEVDFTQLVFFQDGYT